VAKDDLQKAHTSRAEQLKESDRLRNELRKKAFLAQANLKSIVEKFREQTNVAIQAATATDFRTWTSKLRGSTKESNNGFSMIGPHSSGGDY
jgi:signal transduction histidine kinase